MTACHERIGNVSLVAELRDLVATMLPAHSIVMTRVLQDGTHCGDVIDVACVVDLRRELRVIATHGNNLVVTFTAQMERLSEAALAETNPIVFT